MKTTGLAAGSASFPTPSEQPRSVLHITSGDITAIVPPRPTPGLFVATLQPNGLGSPGYVTARLADGHAPDEIVLAYTSGGIHYRRTWTARANSDADVFALASDTSSTGYVTTAPR